MAMDTSEEHKKFEDDYSPSSTVIKFDRPIPLLRGPLPASPSDDPSAGPYVLAFRDSQAWASSFIACERKIVQQCEEGARIGCAINASSKCKPPWWKALSAPKLSDLKEREICEVREMEECFAEAKVKCVGFAKDKCLVPFRDARIKVGKGVLNLKEAVKLIDWMIVCNTFWVRGNKAPQIKTTLTRKHILHDCYLIPENIIRIAIS
ncbi:hypothetical protein P8452_62098 [Trifolium repens]|nr:hypothetical protein P8452_62098 [Trifolium repens]